MSTTQRREDAQEHLLTRIPASRSFVAWFLVLKINRLQPGSTQSAELNQIFEFKTEGLGLSHI